MPGNYHIFRHCLGSALYGDSQSVYPYFHGSYRGSTADRALYYTELRNLVFAAAAEYFFNLLFPGCYEATGSICGISITRTCYQRNSDPASSGFGRSRRPVVCNADYRTVYGSLCSCDDEKLYSEAGGIRALFFVQEKRGRILCRLIK